MSAMVCASRGFRVHYLGPEVPPAEIARYANETGAGVVALSVLLDDGLSQVATHLRELRAALEPHVAIWLGGRAVQRLDKDALPPHAFVLPGTSELQQRLDTLAF
jgi:methylmalonyl-CoA mutase cobalamin-binding subunit